MGSSSAVALVSGVEYWRSTAWSTAWVFLGSVLEGLSLLPALAGWLQVAVLKSSCSDSESGFPTGFFQCSSSVTSFEHDKDSISTTSSTLCVTPNNRALCAVEGVYFAACYFPSLPQHFSWLFTWLFQRSRSLLLHTAFCEHPLTKWN